MSWGADNAPIVAAGHVVIIGRRGHSLGFLVHELVHAIVPEHSHSQDGLLRGTLDRRLLLAQDLPLGVECVAAVRESLGGSRRTAYTLHHGLL